MKKLKILPYLAIISSITFWGISYIASDISLQYMHPITLVMLRCIIASLILLVVWRKKEPKTRIKKMHITRMLASGFVGIVCYFMFEFYGIKLTSPSIAAIILAAIPIIALLAQRILGKEMLSVRKAAGVIISVIGVALVIGIGTAEQKTNSQIVGYFCMLGAVLSWVIFNYLTIPLYENYSPLTITTFQMIAGVFAIIPIFLLSGQSLPPVNSAVVINVLFLSVFCSALGILLYMYALRSLGILTVTLFINIQPFVTVVASMIILHEFLTGNQMLGGLMVIGAVYISTYKKSLKRKQINLEEI